RQGARIDATVSVTIVDALLLWDACAPRAIASPARSDGVLAIANFSVHQRVFRRGAYAPRNTGLLACAPSGFVTRGKDSGQNVRSARRLEGSVPSSVIPSEAASHAAGLCEGWKESRYVSLSFHHGISPTSLDM